jgi:hypothetical protein
MIRSQFEAFSAILTCVRLWLHILLKQTVKRKTKAIKTIFKIIWYYMLPGLC